MESNNLYTVDAKLQFEFPPQIFTSMQSTFKSFDSNKDGQLDKNEFLSALHSLGHRDTKEEEVNKLMEEMDLNKDGNIQFVEYVKMMKKVLLTEESNVSQLLNKKGEAVFRVGQGQNFSTFSEEERSAYVRVINTVLKNDPDCQKYLPINPESMDVFMLLKDGILLCKLVNAAAKGTIDERSINKKDKMMVYHMSENLNLAINSSKAIGCQIINIDAQTIIDQKFINILGLLWQIIRLILLAQVNLKSHPQLIRLLKDGEQIGDLLKLNPEELLLRWFNYHLTNAGHPNKINNFSEDIKNSEKYLVLLNQLNKSLDTSAISDPSLTKRAESVLSNAKKLNVESYITPTDITTGNQKLNVLFTAAIFNECHGLDPPTEEEYEAAKLLEDDVEGSREERSFRFWMNSLNIPDVYFNNLYEDCKSGLLLLKVIDRIKPGTVEWNKVEMNATNKFKKLSNCNISIEALKKGGFKIVGIGGMDIQEGNRKQILAIIWQLMRCHTLQVIGGKTEEDLLAWGNLMASTDTKVNNLKDPQLKSSLWFIKIMGAIESRAVNWELVHQECTTDEQIENNAKYAISIARKLGATVFLVWEDIKDLKQKMLMTFVAALMEVHNLTDQLKKEKNKAKDLVTDLDA